MGETYNGVQASERGTNSETGETRFSDGAVDDPLLAEAVEEAFGDLVSVSSVSGHSEILPPPIARNESIFASAALLLRRNIFQPN